MVEEGGEVLGRHDAEIHLQPRGELDARLRPAPRERSAARAGAPRGAPRALRIAGGGDDVDVADGLLPAPCRSRDGDLERGGLRPGGARRSPRPPRARPRAARVARRRALRRRRSPSRIRSSVFARSPSRRGGDRPGRPPRALRPSRFRAPRGAPRSSSARARAPAAARGCRAGALPAADRGAPAAGPVQLADLLRERLADAGHLREATAPRAARSSSASTARAPFSYARTLNGFSPSSSRSVPISRSARATANLSSIDRYIYGPLHHAAGPRHRRSPRRRAHRDRRRLPRCARAREALRPSEVLIEVLPRSARVELDGRPLGAGGGAVASPPQRTSTSCGYRPRATSRRSGCCPPAASTARGSRRRSGRCFGSPGRSARRRSARHRGRSSRPGDAGCCGVRRSRRTVDPPRSPSPIALGDARAGWRARPPAEPRSTWAAARRSPGCRRGGALERRRRGARVVDRCVPGRGGGDGARWRHRHEAPRAVRIFVVTASDTRGEAEDESGAYLRGDRRRRGTPSPDTGS